MGKFSPSPYYQFVFSWLSAALILRAQACHHHFSQIHQFLFLDPTNQFQAISSKFKQIQAIPNEENLFEIFSSSASNFYFWTHGSIAVSAGQLGMENQILGFSRHRPSCTKKNRDTSSAQKRIMTQALHEKES